MPGSHHRRIRSRQALITPGRTYPRETARDPLSPSPRRRPPRRRRNRARGPAFPVPANDRPPRACERNRTRSNGLYLSPFLIVVLAACFARTEQGAAGSSRAHRAAYVIAWRALQAAVAQALRLHLAMTGDRPPVALAVRGVGYQARSEAAGDREPPIRLRRVLAASQHALHAGDMDRGAQRQALHAPARQRVAGPGSVLPGVLELEHGVAELEELF